MSYRIEIKNRIWVGFSIGWAWYGEDVDHPYNEWIIYIGLISINILYK